MRLPFLLFGLILLACSQPNPESAPETNAPAIAQPRPPGFSETFEAGTKGGYAASQEILPSGRWQFEDALIGSADQDHKNGQRAARLRGRGRLTMLFDAPAGVRRIRVFSACYGQDAASTWELWLSRDGGRSFERGGLPVAVREARLSVRTFDFAGQGPLRLQIRKTDGGGGRLNIDDIEVAMEGRPTAGPTSASPPVPDAPAPRPPAGQRDNHLALGNPSGATSDLTSLTNYLVAKPQYTCAYNARRGTPTWVSWHLSAAWLGQAPRQDDFRPDAALPRQFYAVTPQSYRGSGFDRGHCCPSGDRTADLDDNSATFLMTNMLPQAPHNNQQTWSALEEYARSQVRRGQEMYIIMGGYGQGGTGTNGTVTTLDQGRVTVPARIWKVLVILPEGSNDLARIAAAGPDVRVMAVDTPNEQAVNPDWRQYLTSINKIEAATGLDLLSALPLPAQARLQKLVDSGRAQ